MFKNKVIIFFIIVFGLLASRDLLRFGYFPMHDDLQMMRQLELEKCFLDGQVPCRWVPDMGYGFGYPLFNFYPPLPYFIGGIFRVLGFAFTDTAKYTFALSMILSGVGMYLFARSFFGKVGGFVSAVFYMWAPYHALDIYVRGAMNEAWAMTFFPFVFYTLYKLVTAPSGHIPKWKVLLTLSYAGLFLSHNLMLMIFTPVFGVWTLFIIWQKSAYKRLVPIALAGLWAFGLSAFFTLPAIFENKYTWIRSQLTGYYDYTAHFVSIGQLLFSRYWGYGGSIFGPDDGMAFPIGHIHWLLSIVGGILALVVMFKNRKAFGSFLKSDSLWPSILFFFVVGWFVAFLTHSKSIFIWLAVPQLAYLQFPWRLLTLSTFSFAFIAGVIPALFVLFKKHKNRLLRFFISLPQTLLAMILVFLVVVWNWEFFKVERIGPVTDSEKFSGEAWRLQQTAGILDYLPTTAEMAPQNQRGVEVEIMTGKGEVSNFSQGTYWAKFDVNLAASSQVRLNILYFPGWRVFSNGSEIPVSVPSEEKWGRMWLNLEEGKHTIYAQLFNTPIRTASNVLSLLSIVALVYFTLFRLKRSKS